MSRSLTLGLCTLMLVTLLAGTVGAARTSPDLAVAADSPLSVGGLGSALGVGSVPNAPHDGEPGNGPATRSAPETAECAAPPPSLSLPDTATIGSPTSRGEVAHDASYPAPDYGAVAGSVRLCLDGAAGALTSVDPDASCSWSRDRTRIEHVSSYLRITVDGARYDVFVYRDEERPAGISLDRRRRPDRPLYYSSSDGGELTMTGARDGSSGTARFIALPASRRGVPLTGEEPLSGTVRWRCAAPPPFERGYTPGSFVFHLSAPVDRTFRTKASCMWESAESGLFVGQVDGYDLRAPFGELFVSMLLYLDPGPGMNNVRAIVHVSEAHQSLGTYGGNDDWPDLNLVVDSSRSGNSGTVRFIDLGVVEMRDGPPLGGPDGPISISGWASWECGDPPARAYQHYPWETDSTTPGEVTIRMHLEESAPDEFVEMTVRARCQGRDWVRAVIPLRDELVVLSLEPWDFMALLRSSASGRYLGEYLSVEETSLVRSSAGVRPRMLFGALDLTGPDPDPVPLGGPGGPMSIRGFVEWECSGR